MELIMDYKEGNLMNEGNTLYLVLFKTLYNMVIVEFNRDMLVTPYSEWKNKLPIFTWKNYDLTNKDDIEKLNIKFVVTSTNNLNKFPIVYDVEVGSVVEFNYKQMMLMGRTERKVLSFTLIRPILFDFKKAKEKYIVADRLNELFDLQNEFDFNWAEYLITPFASEENIDWNVIRDRLPFEEVIGKDFIVNEFAPYPTEKITLDEFYNVINSKKLNQIKDESIKNEIINLIKQTLILAKENNSIGIKSEPKKPKKPSMEEVRFNVEFTYKLDPSDDEVLTVEEFVYGVDEEDVLAKAPNYFYDIYDGKNYDLISVSLAKEQELITPAIPTKKVVKLSNLRKGDRFTFPLSQDDIDLGVTEMIYVFDDKAKSTFFYKSGDSEFYTSENREVNLLPKQTVIEKPIEETENLDDLLALYQIGETENIEDLLKLYE